MSLFPIHPLNQNWCSHIEFPPEYLEWQQIVEASKKNEALRIQLEHVKILYYLGKEANGT